MSLRSLHSLVVFGLIAVACASPGTPAASRLPAASGHDSTLQLFLLAGQSNMAGRGAVEGRDSVVDTRVLRLGPGMTWAPAVDPLHWDKPATLVKR